MKFLGIICEIHPEKVKIYSAPSVKLLLRRFCMENCKSMNTSIALGTVLERVKPDEILPDDRNRYGKQVGPLLCLSNITILDIWSAMEVCTRYMEQPRKAHWKAALLVLR